MKWPGGSNIAAALTGSCVLSLVSGGSAEADFVFGTPINPGPPINSSASDQPGGMTADGLEFYIGSQRSGGYSGWIDIWVATRPTKDDPWGEPVNLGPAINTERSEFESDITPDGLILVFTRAGTDPPDWDIWMATRPTRDDPWGQRQNLGPTINSPVEDMDACLSADGLTLYFNSRRVGGHGDMDIYVSTRPTRSDPWGQPVNLGPPVNGPFSDACPEVSADGRIMFFNSRRPGGLGDSDLWMTRRPTTDDPWGEPVHLGPTVNTPGLEQYPDISPDGRWLMFQTGNLPGGTGGMDIWQVPIIPVVDFNGDEVVDIKDLLILIESWGQNDPAVDIGPTPLGDGVVDAADLEALMAYWGQEPPDPWLIAHWKLDESQGMTAHDSAGVNDGTVMGAALWQPGGGYVDGALEFDGTTFVVADSAVGPASPFSVFAWVKGGGSDQVILSQQTGANWLMTDVATGALMTELQGVGRLARPLYSATLIRDGDWHRVGLTWDGSKRRLYVDDILASEDIQSALEDCSGGITIGCGNAMAAGTFFTGLIDDVRIYKRAVEP